MKHFIRLFSVCLFLAVAAGCRQQDFRVAEVRVPNVYNVACEKRILAALTQIEGIDVETMKFTNGVMTVRYDSMMLGLKNIEHAIKDAGFDANEFQADPAARAKLPKECLIMATR